MGLCCFLVTKRDSNPKLQRCIVIFVGVVVLSATSVDGMVRLQGFQGGKSVFSQGHFWGLAAGGRRLEDASDAHLTQEPELSDWMPRRGKSGLRSNYNMPLYHSDRCT